MMVAKGAWGWGLRRTMMDYNHWAALGVLGEILPHEDNRVQLAVDTDRFGLPVARVTFSLHDTDRKVARADIPNLLVCDGSLLSTQGSANPGLTIQALAARTADYLISNGADVLLRQPRTVVVPRPPVRHDMSPPETWGKGVPRIKQGRARNREMK